MKRYVLDTNVLVASISSRSPHHWIWQTLIYEKGFQLCVTTEILQEYEEVLQRFYGKEVAETVLETLEMLPNIVFIIRYYAWNLIKEDPDDNKFVDCAIAGQAELIVSEDKHFNVLKSYPFPKVLVVRIAEFKEILAK